MPQPRPPETSGAPDMTKSLAAQAKPSGRLSHPRPLATPIKLKAPPTTTSAAQSASLTPEPLHKQVYQTRLTRAKCRCPTNVSTQVSRLKGWPVSALFFTTLLMLLPYASGKPWLEKTPHDVTFNVPMCRSLSTADLQRMMGAAWDESRMAPDMATAKRTFGPEDNDESGIPGFQGDDPRASTAMTEREDLVAEEKVWGSSSELWVDEREEDVYTEGGVLDGLENEDEEEVEEVEEEEEEEEVVVERRTWLPRHGTRRHSSFRNRRRFRYSKFGVDAGENSDDRDESKRKTVLSNPYGFMRRRRSTSGQTPHSERKSRARDEKSHLYDSTYDDIPEGGEAYSDDVEADDPSSDSNDEGSKDNNILPLRLILSGRNKKLRRQLKKKFRQKAKKLRKKDPPWTCKMRQKMLFMKQGVFPRVLRQGECESNKCFYRLYNCEPSKYAITLLQRDPDHCNPIPAIGNATVYEERWNLARYHVTVACNCASMVGGRKYKGRRRD